MATTVRRKRAARVPREQKQNLIQNNTMENDDLLSRLKEELPPEVVEASPEAMASAMRPEPEEIITSNEKLPSKRTSKIASEIDSLMKKISNLEQENATLNVKLQSSAEQESKDKSKLLHEQSQVLQEMRELEHNLREAEIIKSQLREQIESLQCEKEEFQKEARQKQMELEEENEELTEALESQQENASEEEHVLQEKNMKLRESIQQTTKENVLLGKDLQSNRQKLVEQEKDLQRFKDTLSVQKEEAMELRKKLQISEESAAEMTVEVQSLEETIKEKEKSFHEKIQDLNSENERLKSQLNEKGNEKSTQLQYLEDEIEKLKERLQERENINQELKAKLSQQAIAHSELKKHYENFISSKEHENILKDSNGKFEDEINLMKLNESNLNGEINRLKSELDKKASVTTASEDYLRENKDLHKILAIIKDALGIESFQLQEATKPKELQSRLQFLCQLKNDIGKQLQRPYSISDFAQAVHKKEVVLAFSAAEERNICSVVAKREVATSNEDVSTLESLHKQIAQLQNSLAKEEAKSLKELLSKQYQDLLQTKLSELKIKNEKDLSELRLALKELQEENSRLHEKLKNKDSAATSGSSSSDDFVTLSPNETSLLANLTGTLEFLEPVTLEARGSLGDKLGLLLKAVKSLYNQRIKDETSIQMLSNLYNELYKELSRKEKQLYNTQFQNSILVSKCHHYSSSVDMKGSENEQQFLELNKKLKNQEKELEELRKTYPTLVEAQREIISTLAKGK